MSSAQLQPQLVLHFLCSFCDKKYSFIHKKNVTCHKVFVIISITGKKFPVIRNILYFTDRYHTPFVTRGILFVTESFSGDMGLFNHVTGNVLPITRSTVCITWRTFFVTVMISHFALLQEISFLWDKIIIFSCNTRSTSCKRTCSSSCNRYSSYVYKQ